MTCRHQGPKVTAGAVLIAIGALHQLFGVVAGVGAMTAAEGGEARAPLLEIARAGLVDAVEPDPWRMTFYWFLMTGFLLLALGAVAHRAERAGVTSTRGLALALLGLALVGGLALPVSGVWLLAVPAVMMWRRASPSRAVPSAVP